MKRNELMAIIATCFLLFAVCLSASAKSKKDIERGMTKQEVIAILGEPKAKSFDEYGDKWEFFKSLGLSGDYKSIKVVFSRDGKVISCNTELIRDNDNHVTVNQPCPPPTRPSFGNGTRPNGQMQYGYCLSDASFSILYNKVKKASFSNDKYDLIEVASLGGYFSCQQAASLMKIFSFDDERLKVLKIVAPHIVDVQNAKDIYKLFTFDSGKQKAGDLLRNSR